jgi:hypothetical protein
MENCNQTNCPFFDKYEGCGHPSAPSPEDCDILPALPKVEEIKLDPPMYVRFSYRDEWRHIPANEVYPVWTEMDFGFAANTFREIHGSNGALTVFSTMNSIDWKVWGELPEEKDLPAESGSAGI